jgi:hypothetical protein
MSIALKTNDMEPSLGWAQEEMRQWTGCDKRTRRRVEQLLHCCASKPGASLPEACGSWSQTRAIYRCLSNPAVEAAQLLASHREATWQRHQGHRVVLALADTTSLNHTSHPATEGLGPIHVAGSSSRGMLMHSVLALSEQGEPLGLLHIHPWVRTAVRGRKNQGSKNSRPVGQKESQRWISAYEEVARQSQQHQADGQTSRLIMVCDREGDIYELLLAAQTHKQACGLLVRAQYGRSLEESQQIVWEHLQEKAAWGQVQVQVPAQGSRPARVATLSVRSAAVRLGVPVDKQRLFGATEGLDVWVIEAVEDHTPKGQKALHWKLLSTEAASDLAQASEQLQWYAKRWNIEVFHRTLKSGCHVERRQLCTYEGLERMLMIDAIVAWRLMAMTHAARHQPEAPASQWLEPTECRVLSCWATKNAAFKQPPSIKQAVYWIARIGGFLGRKSDGAPGVQCLWRGMLGLQSMVELWNAQKNVGNL